MPAVVHPLRASAEAASIGDFLHAGAVRANQVDLGQLLPLPTAFGERRRDAAPGREGDPVAVGRPRRAVVAPGPGCKRPRAPRSDIERPDIRIAAARVLTNTSCLPS